MAHADAEARHRQRFGASPNREARRRPLRRRFAKGVSSCPRAGGISFARWRGAPDSSGYPTRVILAAVVLCVAPRRVGRVALVAARIADGPKPASARLRREPAGAPRGTAVAATAAAGAGGSRDASGAGARVGPRRGRRPQTGRVPATRRQRGWSPRSTQRGAARQRRSRSGEPRAPGAGRRADRGAHQRRVRQVRRLGSGARGSAGAGGPSAAAGPGASASRVQAVPSTSTPPMPPCSTRCPAWALDGGQDRRRPRGQRPVRLGRRPRAGHGDRSQEARRAEGPRLCPMSAPRPFGPRSRRSRGWRWGRGSASCSPRQCRGGRCSLAPVSARGARRYWRRRCAVALVARRCPGDCSRSSFAEAV